MRKTKTFRHQDREDEPEHETASVDAPEPRSAS
jgi:hypothetical protein